MTQQDQLPAVAPDLDQRGMSPIQWSAVKNIWPGAKDASVLMAYDYCVARKLDPFKKPVHIVPMWVEDKQTGQKGTRDVVMPGIHEIRTTAFRTGQYAGQDEAEFGPDIEFQGITVPEWCKVTVYRFIEGEPRPFTHKEFYAEAYATKDRNSTTPNSMWTKRRRGQLKKCAEAGALRMAFPEEIGDVMTAEEMVGKTVDIDVTPTAPRTERGQAGGLNEAEGVPAKGATERLKAKAEKPKPAPVAPEADEPKPSDLDTVVADFKKEIAEAKDEATMRAIGDRVAQEPAEVQDRVRALWGGRMKVIRQQAEKPRLGA